MRRILSVIVLVVSLAVPMTSRASATFEPTLSVTPAAGVVDGESVTVSGSHWAPGEPITLLECALLDGSSTCLPTVQTNATANGNFTATYVARRFVAQYDCVELLEVVPEPGCGIVAQAFSVSHVVKGARMEFAGTRIADLALRRRSDGVLRYDNVYTPDPAVQTGTHPIASGGTWLYSVLVQNDGPTDADIIVTGSALNDPFKVGYSVSYFDVTSLVEGGGLTWHLASGASYLLAVKITASSATAAGATAALELGTRISTAGSAQDAMTLSVIATS